MRERLEGVKRMCRVSLQAESSALRYILFALALVFCVALLDFAFVIGSFSSIEKTLLTLIALITFGAGIFALMSD